jgi:hypothetical protein
MRLQFSILLPHSNNDLRQSANIFAGTFSLQERKSLIIINYKILPAEPSLSRQSFMNASAQWRCLRADLLEKNHI